MFYVFGGVAGDKGVGLACFAKDADEAGDDQIEFPGELRSRLIWQSSLQGIQEFFGAGFELFACDALYGFGFCAAATNELSAHGMGYPIVGGAA